MGYGDDYSTYERIRSWAVKDIYKELLGESYDSDDYEVSNELSQFLASFCTKKG